jgi:hypothetical protein
MQSRDGQALMQMLSAEIRELSPAGGPVRRQGQPAEIMRMMNQVMQSPPEGAGPTDQPQLEAEVT